MYITTRNNIKHVSINPGEYYASGDQVIISTILGSCVSACIYDPLAGIVGMNHFLLSNKRYARDMKYYLTDAGRYGVNAMELVINDMLKMGARRENLRAKAFGGSSLLGITASENFFCVGEVNSRFILDFLKNEGIRLVSSNLGGDRGRVIRFSSVDYSVLMRMIGKNAMPNIVKEEKKFWIKSIKKQEKAEGPELWG
ncbi:MAG: chemotaxis protein CheD [Deltaproteobacteria bacterium]|nr:chemotaxis protein CheD [Deltaproteobacteria bacterium]